MPISCSTWLLDFMHTRQDTKIVLTSLVPTPVAAAVLLDTTPPHPPDQSGILMDRPPPWPLWKLWSMFCTLHGKAWLLSMPPRSPEAIFEHIHGQVMCQLARSMQAHLVFEEVRSISNSPFSSDISCTAATCWVLVHWAPWRQGGFSFRSVVAQSRRQRYSIGYQVQYILRLCIHLPWDSGIFK
jgi:hypothetical protein